MKNKITRRIFPKPREFNFVYTAIPGEPISGVFAYKGNDTISLSIDELAFMVSQSPLNMRLVSFEDLNQLYALAEQGWEADHAVEGGERPKYLRDVDKLLRPPEEFLG